MRWVALYVALVLGVLALALAAARAEPFQQAGGASFYAGRHQGRLTANGERFNMMAMTAAHRRIRFNALVTVTALRTGRQVVVRINDRGPYRRGRIIDLSLAAARALGIERQGVAEVLLSVERP
jgi:rare lipoprotein A